MKKKNKNNEGKNSKERDCKRRPKYPVLIEQDLDAGDLGECNYYKGKIRIEPGLSAGIRLGTVVHEALHWALPEYDEEKIEEIEDIVTEILWNDGYRKVDLE